MALQREYVVDGPDGSRYYEIIGMPIHAASLYENLALAYQAATRRPRGLGRAQAVEIALLSKEIQRRMDRVAVRTASFATDAVRKRVIATRKRPGSAQGSSQSGRLWGAILSKPVHVILPRGSGAVGVGQIEKLEAETKSGHPTKSPYPYYWRAQEDGSSAMQGRTIFGVFQPGQAFPSGAENRRHPIFEKRGRGQGRRGKLEIKNPIEAKNFLKDGAMDARAFRRSQSAVVEKFAISRMDAIAAQRAIGPRGRISRPRQP